MSDFMAKMYQIQFRLGLYPDPAEGAYSAPPDPLAGLRRPTSKGRGEDGREGGEDGKGRERRGEGEVRRRIKSNQINS